MYAAVGGGVNSLLLLTSVFFLLLLLFFFIYIKHSRSRVFDGGIRDSYEMYRLKELGPWDWACYNNIIPYT